MRGEKLTEWCHTHNLTLGDTWFQQPTKKETDMENPRIWKQESDRLHPGQ